MRRILLIENHGSDFHSTRLPLCKYLRAQGWDVYALLPNSEYVELIQSEGINAIGYDLDRRDVGVRHLIRLVRICREITNRLDIDIVHSFRFLPNLLNIVANCFNSRKVIVHITGLGVAFSNFSFPYLLLKILSQIAFQIVLFRANKVIVQNEDDAKDILFAKLWNRKVVVIEGSGVDTSFFNKALANRAKLRIGSNVSTDDMIFICVTRLLWEKGIGEMVDAFQSLKESEPFAKLWVVGWPDKENPRHVQDSYIKKFEKETNIRFLGKRDNIRDLLAMADVFIYPSYYREGIPRGILEALSMGLPIITTDMPGCRLTTAEGENGYLISPRSSDEIGQAAMRMIHGSNLAEMGMKSRKLAENRFKDTLIYSQISALYAE